MEISDLWLAYVQGVLGLVIAVLGFTVSLWQPGRFWKWFMAVAFFALGAAFTAVSLTIQQRAAAQAERTEKTIGELKASNAGFEVTLDRVDTTLAAMADHSSGLPLKIRARALSSGMFSFLAIYEAHKPFPGTLPHEQMVQHLNATQAKYSDRFGGKIIAIRAELVAARVPKELLWNEWMQTELIKGREVAERIAAAAETLK